MSKHESVLKSYLCTACGACEGICPKKAITMIENKAGYISAEINNEKCVQCGLCDLVCPSVSTNQTINKLENSINGQYLRGMIGYATNKRIRGEGQSGGLVTGLLLYLLNNNLIDGAVINRFSSERNRPEAAYVETEDDIISGSGSYYSQTPVVSEILKHEDKRLAAVVLGCEAEALKLIKEKINRKVPEYTIGLACTGQNSGHIIDELEACLGASKAQIAKKFRFKYSHPAYGGWPGNVYIVTDKGRYIVSAKERFKLKKIWESYRCLLCYDLLNVYADIVCGDPWRISGNHKKGETIVIVRTPKGHKLLQGAISAGYIDAEDIDASTLIKAQTSDGDFYKKVIACKEYTEKKGWEYPYTLINQKNQYRMTKKERRGYEQRLKYTRQLYSAQSADAVSDLVMKKKKMDNRKDKFCYLLKVVSFPVRRFLRFFKK